jgi:hypothetical protein
MTQALYAHMNNKKKKSEPSTNIFFSQKTQPGVGIMAQVVVLA